MKNRLVYNAKRSVEKNIYVDELVRRFIHCGQNRTYLRAVEKFEKIDSLADYEKFRHEVQKLKNESITSRSFFSFSGVGAESLHYGHLHALLTYAGVSEGDAQRLALSYIEHGIAYTDELPENMLKPYVAATVSQGPYRLRAFRLARPDIPHYQVGPYIAYAQSWYAQEKLSKLKEAYGRTLLVFPSHTHEMSTIDYGRQRFVDEIMYFAEGRFDTVVVSAYWLDVDDPVYDLFEKAGAIVASAGIRADRFFIDRLKTMLLVSDAVIGNGIGTHIGYSLFLGKPFYFMVAPGMDLDDGEHKTKENELRGIERVFQQTFPLDSTGLDLSGNQERLYKLYWGGDGFVKSPSEIRALLSLTNRVLDLSKGFGSQYYSSYKTIAGEMTCSGEELSLLELKLIREGFSDVE